MNCIHLMTWIVVMTVSYFSTCKGVRAREENRPGNLSSICLSMNGTLFRHSCYVVSIEQMELTWQQAFDRCQDGRNLTAGFHGRLAWFLSKESWGKVSGKVLQGNVERFWIGLGKVDDSDTRRSVHWWKDKKSSSLKVDWAPDRCGIDMNKFNYVNKGQMCFLAWLYDKQDDRLNEVNYGWSDTECKETRNYLCEYVANPCYYANPCLNGGTCEPTITGSPNCTCLDTYKGDFCQIAPQSIGVKIGNNNKVIAVLISTLAMIMLTDL